MIAWVDGRATYLYTGSRAFDPALPSVVFVHGAGADHTVWLLQSRWFAHHGFNALAVDLPGHGRSQGRPLAGIGEMADWIARLLDSLDVKRAAVAGHSMGSLVALEFAARHPDRVRAAGLVGIAVPMAVADILLQAAEENRHEAIDMITQWGHGPGARIGGNPVPGMWMTGAAERLLERAAPGVLYSDLGACARYANGMSAAARTRCPTAVVLGTRDIMAPARVAEALAAAIPGSRVTRLEAGHMLMAEAPDAVLDALRAVFAQSSARPE